MGRRAPRPCGTAAAYRRHLRHGQMPCRPCRDAHVTAGAPFLARLRPGRRLRPCGTQTAYQRHIRRKEVPCTACCAAHAAAQAALRARIGRTTGRADDPLLYRAASAGLEPAETLSTADRHRLVARFHERGWTDAEIAARTRMTLYTTARIRAALGLLPRTRPSAQPSEEAAA